MNYLQELTEVNKKLAAAQERTQELLTELAIAKAKREELRLKHNELVEKAKPQTTIYCGTFDQVEFFSQIISALGLDIDYEVRIVDGEYEIEIATSEGQQ